jgi:hypothetical protein
MSTTTWGEASGGAQEAALDLFRLERLEEELTLRIEKLRERHWHYPNPTSEQQLEQLDEEHGTLRSRIRELRAHI